MQAPSPAPSSVESLAPDASGRVVFGMAWPGWAHALVLAVFALSSLLSTGYGFASNDASIYLPLTWIRLEPGLYPTDEVFGWVRDSSWSRNAAFFSLTTALGAKFASLEWVVFGLHSLCLWGLFVAWWRIGRSVGGPAVGYLAMALLALSQPIGGTQMLTIPHEYQSRVVGATLAFWAVAEAVDAGRVRVAALLAGIAALYHPVSALMALPLVAITPLWGQDHGLVRIKQVATVGILMVLPVVLWRCVNDSGPLTDTGFLTAVGPVWQSVIDYRLQGQAVDVTWWRPDQWASVAVPVIIWGLALRERSFGRIDRILVCGGVATVGLVVLGVIGAECLRLSLFKQLMLARLLYLPMVVGLVYGAWWLKERWMQGRPSELPWVLFVGAALASGAPELAAIGIVPLVFRHWGISCATAVGVCAIAFSGPGTGVPVARTFVAYFNDPPTLAVLVCAGLAGVFLAPRRRETLRWAATALAPIVLLLVTSLPTGTGKAVHRLSHGVEAPWLPARNGIAEVAYWARGHTPPASRFLAPFWDNGFRAMAKRGIVTDWKDGGVALFSEAFAKRWFLLHRLVKDYETGDLDDVRSLAVKFDCQYVIRPKSWPLALPVAFEGADYVVYELGD